MATTSREIVAGLPQANKPGTSLARYVSLALRKLHASTHPKHRLVAVIVSGGRVLAFASNGARWGHHAEKRALAQAGAVDGAFCLVVREGRRTSKPCAACQGALKAAGIKRAYYFDASCKMSYINL